MAKQVVSERGISIRLACPFFSLSETCYRYDAKRDAENDRIADWFLRLTENYRNWGFGLCFLFLRNVKGFAWNH
jgi:putative transposase